jgi:hypothetical protein
MGLHDRDYMKDSSGSWESAGSPTRRTHSPKGTDRTIWIMLAIIAGSIVLAKLNTLSLAHRAPEVYEGAGQAMRMYCPGCGAWMQHDSVDFTAMFMEGLEPGTPELEAIQAEQARTLPFLQQHAECSVGSLRPIEFLYHGDPRYGQVAPELEYRPAD